ncbi:Ff.00g061730.m01.CDS01 [Fusarium sp. VM40]|nr:Ff.00g061730.m01.CDS01 [Fusarium sp. VM40]
MPRKSVHHHHHHHHHYQNEDGLDYYGLGDHHEAIGEQNQKAVKIDKAVFAVLRDSFVVVNFERLQSRNNADDRDSQTRHASRPKLQPRPRLQPRPQSRLQPVIPATNPFSGKLRNLHLIEKAFAYEYGLSHPKTLSVRNVTQEGPQMDICWKVPDKYVWLARVSTQDMASELVTLALSLSPPGWSNISMIWRGEYGSEISIILCTHRKEYVDKVENGEGEVILFGHQKIATLGRLLGFEVKEGQGPLVLL